MHYNILGFKNDSRCQVEVIKAETINIKRILSKTFTFKDPDSFIDALKGHNSIAVYVGKEANEEAEKWRAYYIEPSDPNKDSWSYERNMLPLGTLAILDMDTEFDLEWTLEKRAKEATRYIEIFHQIGELSRKIYRIDRDHRYADTDQFRYMTPEELEQVLKDIDEAYQKLAQKGDVEL